MLTISRVHHFLYICSLWRSIIASQTNKSFTSCLNSFKKNHLQNSETKMNKFRLTIVAFLAVLVFTATGIYNLVSLYFYNVTFLSLASLTRSTFWFICFLSLFHLAVSNSLNDPKMNTLPKSECILHAGCLNHIACKLCAYQDCKCDHGKCKCLRPEPPSQWSNSLSPIYSNVCSAKANKTQCFQLIKLIIKIIYRIHFVAEIRTWFRLQIFSWLNWSS